MLSKASYFRLLRDASKLSVVSGSTDHYRKAEPSVMGSVGAFWGSVEPHGGFVGIRKQPQNCIQDDVFNA
jgi:hypothetical protein